MRYLLILLALFSLKAGTAELPPRVSALSMDRGHVGKIFMAPGMVTSLQFPHGSVVTDIKVGNLNDLEAEISPRLKSEVILHLKYAKAQPTNVLVLIGEQTYAFDVIPALTVHQDVVKVLSSFGAPALTDSTLKVIAESKNTKPFGTLMLLGSSEDTK